MFTHATQQYFWDEELYCTEERRGSRIHSLRWMKRERIHRKKEWAKYRKLSHFSSDVSFNNIRELLHCVSLLCCPIDWDGIQTVFCVETAVWKRKNLLNVHDCPLTRVKVTEKKWMRAGGKVISAKKTKDHEDVMKLIYFQEERRQTTTTKRYPKMQS